MPTFGPLPWETQPALHPEHIATVATWIREVRDTVALGLDEQAGDLHFGGWVPGTASHARFAKRVTQEALSGQHPWLRVIDGTQQFAFAINHVPVRVFRGSPDTPSVRHRKKSPAEVSAQAEAFALERILLVDPEWVWRFVVEVNPRDYRVDRVSFCEISSDEDNICVRSCYEIPMVSAGASITSISEGRPDGVELEPAAVEELDETAGESGEEPTTPRSSQGGE